MVIIHAVELFFLQCGLKKEEEGEGRGGMTFFSKKRGGGRSAVRCVCVRETERTYHILLIW